MASWTAPVTGFKGNQFLFAALPDCLPNPPGEGNAAHQKANFLNPKPVVAAGPGYGGRIAGPARSKLQPQL